MRDVIVIVVLVLLLLFLQPDPRWQFCAISLGFLLVGLWLLTRLSNRDD